MNNAERLVMKPARGDPPRAPAKDGRSSAAARAGEATGPRRPYDPPELEPLGRFRALTLQQSLPIGPGG